MDNFNIKKYLAEGKLLKEDISSHKEEAKRFLEKFIDDNGDTFEFIPDLKTGYIDTKDNSYNVDELASIFLDIGQDIPRGKYNKKYKGKGGTYVVVAEGKLLKEELRDVEDILVKSGFRFDDGILGGVGSGGAGYYDSVNDNIYGYNQSGPWNEKEFNKFYDNFKFNSNLYDREDLEDLEISQPQLDKGIYAVEDMGYVEIRSNGDVEIYAIPQLADEDDSNFLPAFKMDASGRAIPQFSKDEMRKMLKDDMMYIL